MIALIIILALLVLLALLPLGVNASYDGAFRLSALIWFYPVRLYPPKDKPEPEPQESETEEKPKRSLPRFTAKEWRELIKTAYRALRRFKHGVYFNNIMLHCMVSANDPYDAVMRYNAVNGFVGGMMPIFESDFKVRHRDVIIDLDTDSGISSIKFDVRANVRLGTIIAVAIAAGVKILKILIKNKLHRKNERKARNGEQQTERNDAADDEKHQEPC